MRHWTPEELLELLEFARRHNAAAGITGMLLYKDGNFIQALEGPEAAVRALYRRIQLDTRHRGILKLLDEPIAARRFEHWSMGFRHLTDEVLGLAGFSDLMNRPFSSASFAANPALCQSLLLTFRENM